MAKAKQCHIPGCASRANNLALFRFTLGGEPEQFDEVLVNTPLCKAHAADDGVMFGLIASAVGLMINRGHKLTADDLASIAFRHLDGAAPLTSGAPR